MRSYVHNFDYQIIKSIQSLPEWLHSLMLFASVIGHPVSAVVIIGGVALCGWQTLQPKLFLASIVALGTIGVNTLLKMVFQRARPETVYVENMYSTSFSLPSGHSCAAVIAFGLLAYVLHHYLPQPFGYIAIVVLILMAVLVGVSRVYLGAHYPTDVIAGWLVGLIGLFIIIFVVRPL